MSYYRPSFAQSTGSGMSRGRGGSFSSSRGSSSYRGGSSRGSSSWNSSSSRGYHGTSSRGGGSSGAYRSSGGGYSGSFDTRSVGSKYGERIPSFRGSGGGGEEYRKQSYRPDSSYSRESRMSPERKRMRTESRHDAYSGDSSMSSRYSDTSFSRSKQQQMTSTPFHRATSGGDFRKPLAPPPPPNISNYSGSSGSGRIGYRGSRISSRYIVSSSRDGTIRNSSLRPAPRRLMDYGTSTTTWRGSRGGASIRSSEYARRLRLRQLTNRSAIIRSSRPIHTSSRIKRNDSDDELWGAVRDDDDDEEEDNDEDNEETVEKETKAKESAKDSSGENEADLKAAKPDDDSKDDDKDGDDDEGKDEDKSKGAEGDGEETIVVKKKTSIKKVSSSKERERESSPEDPMSHRKQFIKLVCPYCHTRCITFSRYSNHLRSARHSAAMHHVALKQKTALSRMRIAQRAEQKTIERSDNAELTSHTNFCPLCKLNYRQTKVVHRASKAHRDMKRFLMPVCKICQITCKSPMLYETHCASLEHIKRKAYAAQNGDKSDKSDHSGDDLQNYMTIDSVGDMDDIDMDLPPPPSVSDLNIKETSTLELSSDAETKSSSAKPKNDKDKHSSSSKREREPQINVGVENIRKIEVHYCDLCRMYLPREDDVHDDLERILAKHCKQRTHMQRYIRYKEDKDLAKRAERLQRREMAEKEKEKDAKKAVKIEESTTSKPSIQSDQSSASNIEDIAASSTLNQTQDVVVKDAAAESNLNEEEKLLEDDEEHPEDVKEIQEADEAEAGEDKLWEDVDKDLGDILDGEKQEEDEEEEDEEEDGRVVNGERYDRFKYSEKNAKSGSVAAKVPPKAAAKKAEADAGVGEKNQVEGETTK